MICGEVSRIRLKWMRDKLGTGTNLVYADLYVHEEEMVRKYLGTKMVGTEYLKNEMWMLKHYNILKLSLAWPQFHMQSQF